MAREARAARRARQSFRRYHRPVRTLALRTKLAALLGRLRASRGLPDATVRVRLQDLERVERELGVVLPDAVVAYVAAGVSLWDGVSPPSIASLVDRTREVQELVGEWGDEGARPRSRFVIVDDDANGNYLGVEQGAAKDGETLAFFDHETGYSVEIRYPLADAIEQALEDQPDAAAAPLTVELFDEPDPEPEPVWVRHAKFGRGRVVAEEEDTLTIAFDAVGQKRLKRSFVQPD